MSDWPVLPPPPEGASGWDIYDVTDPARPQFLQSTGDDDLDSEPCSHCGGEWYMQECDDPIQCCEPRCDGQWHPCVACNGTGLAKNQWCW